MNVWIHMPSHLNTKGTSARERQISKHSFNTANVKDKNETVFHSVNGFGASVLWSLEYTFSLEYWNKRNSNLIAIGSLKFLCACVRVCVKVEPLYRNSIL